MELAEMIVKIIIDNEVPRDKKSCGIVSSALISTGRIDFWKKMLPGGMSNFSLPGVWQGVN